MSLNPDKDTDSSKSSIHNNIIICRDQKNPPAVGAAPSKTSVESKILDPCIIFNHTSRAINTITDNEQCLSYIPWRLVYSDTEAERLPQGTNSNNNGREYDNSKDPIIFPPLSYLDLRRQQNLAWAEEKLLEGIQLAKDPTTLDEAEQCYKQALELVGEHVDLFVAYGALLANRGKYEQALEMIDKALQIDPDCDNANKYKESILQISRSKNLLFKNPLLLHGMGNVAADKEAEGIVKILPNENENDATDDNIDYNSENDRYILGSAAVRREKAMQDVLIERDFVSGKFGLREEEDPTNNAMSSFDSALQNKKYPFVFQEESKERLKQFKSKHKSHKKKREHHEYGSDESESSTTRSADEEPKRRSRQHKHSRKKKKKHKKKDKR